MNNIRLQNDWSEERLEEELENRKLVLAWMEQKDIRDYKQVGHIVGEYQKNPQGILTQAQREMECLEIDQI